MLSLPAIFSSMHSQAKSVVEKRLEAVRKDYPQESKINSYISVNGYSGGGCNALVMYATLKIFHNAYDPSCDTFRKIGKTASTNSVSAMRTLLKKRVLVMWYGGVRGMKTGILQFFYLAIPRGSICMKQISVHATRYGISIFGHKKNGRPVVQIKSMFTALKTTTR